MRLLKNGYLACNSKLICVLFIVLFIFFDSLNSNAQSLKLPSIFQSGMVLQQNTKASVWGWAQPGDTIKIQNSWETKVYRDVADTEGRWYINIATPPAGGPYQIKIQSNTVITLNNIMIGEVWVASGQSNMQMPVKGYKNQPVLNSLDLISSSGDNRIRMFTVRHSASDSLKSDFDGTWSEARPETVADFSAVGYVFAKKLEEVLDVPVGIIHSSWGGTSVKSWTDTETLQNLGVMAGSKGGKSNDPHQPAVLFNAMIHPMIFFSMQGVIWYQGERDRGDPELYQKLFPAMIKSWRGKWDQGDFPFYFVQIAPFEYGNNVNSAYLREGQTRTMQQVPHTGMVVTLDIGSEHVIHPPQKEQVGHRLAYWALAKTYNVDGIDYSGPIYRNMKVKDGKAYLYFDYAEMGLTAHGDSLTHFKIAGKDKVFHPAKAQILRNRGVVVWNDEVPHPAAVRYGWENWLKGRLFDTYELPAPSFRTDTW